LINHSTFWMEDQAGSFADKLTSVNWERCDQPKWPTSVFSVITIRNFQ
jgi:hypothetical protein